MKKRRKVSIQKNGVIDAITLVIVIAGILTIFVMNDPSPTGFASKGIRGLVLGNLPEEVSLTLENASTKLDVAPENPTLEAVQPAPEAVSAPPPETKPEVANIIASLEDLPQGTIIVGKPVKWKRVIVLTNESSGVNLSLPPEAENITIKTVVNDQEVPVENFEISDTSKLAG